MRTFLGTPILLHGVAYRNLYLTEKKGGADFDEEDEELVTLLAEQAAVAIDNARRYEAGLLTRSRQERLQIVTDLEEHPKGGTTTLEGGRVGVAVLSNGSPLLTTSGYAWDPWQAVEWHERKKAGFDGLASTMRALDAPG